MITSVHTSFYEQYAQDITNTLRAIDWQPVNDMVRILHTARLQSRQVFVMGNGGSASTASHLACDLNKNTVQSGIPRFKVLACTDNMAAVTAYANDVGYEWVFAEQIRNFLQPEDIVLAISTSGNSPNILRAVEVANRMNAFTIGWTGYRGGKLADLVDLSINVPSNCVEQIEDIHVMLEHMATTALRRAAQDPHTAVLPLSLAYHQAA